MLEVPPGRARWTDGQATKASHMTAQGSTAVHSSTHRAPGIAPGAEGLAKENWRTTLPLSLLISQFLSSDPPPIQTAI